jgi:1-acyl-sn-glycerol-3-phosphate acyltransferase
MERMPPHYRYPLSITFPIIRDLFLGRKRSFVRDAARLSKGIDRLQVHGDVPTDSKPYLFLVNHYSRPGFRAWWISIALVSAAGREMHWPMTSAWTYPDRLRAGLITPLTEWVLARLAGMYGFTLMPPMPPRPEDAIRRADSVRRILRLARSVHPTLAMAPEGMDSPDGRLMQPPPGAGRFIAHLAGAGYTLLPVGAYEAGDSFHLHFGKAFRLPHSDPHDPDTRDRETVRIVMHAIAELLPEEFTPPPSPAPSGLPLPPPHHGEGVAG